MKRPLRFAACLLAAGIFFTVSVYSQTTLVLQPGGALGKDANINSCSANGNDTTNMGSGYELNASAWTYQGNPGGDRSLLQFDLSGVPSGATILSAFLTLYNNPTSSNGLQNGQHSQLSGSNAAWLQRITSPWNESTVTWVNQPPTTTQNEAYLPANTSPHQDYTVDVKALIVDMINNPGSSFGFMLRLQTEQYYRCLLFASSDHPDSTKHPKLVIIYSQCTGLVLQPGVAGKDANINSCHAIGNDTTNNGSNNELNASAWTYQGNPGGDRCLVQFDLSGIPNGAIIQSATLTLFNNPTSSNGLQNGEHSHLSGSNAAWLQRITSFWQENTVTWVSQPTTTTLNEVAMPQDTTPHQNYVMDVKTLVVDMINNPTTSFGFMVRLQTEQYYRCLLFASSDHPDSSLHPKLEICYTTNGSTPPVSSFQSSDSSFCGEIAGCVNFFDHSTGFPTSWQWYFPGASPDTSTQQNPTNICYFNPGTYAVTLITTNANGTDTLKVAPMIVVSPIPPVPTVTLKGDTLFSSHAYAYQWYFNGFPIAGAIDSFYVAKQNGTYSVQVMDSIGCGSLSSGYVFNSVNELSKGALVHIYPNPVSSLAVLTIITGLKNVEIIIYDIVGKEMMRKKLTGDRMEIEKGSLQGGVYFVKVQDSEHQYVQKMVVE